MKAAPLQLLDYWATSLRMSACENYSPSEDTELDLESIKVVHEVKLLDSPDPEKNGTQWLVGLNIEQLPNASANLPYTFAVSLQGVILAFPGLDGERLERSVAANGPAMLFGAAREMVRAATGRGPNNAVIIPSTNFLPNQPEKAEATRAKATKTPKKKSPKKSPKKSAKK